MNGDKNYLTPHVDCGGAQLPRPEGAPISNSNNEEIRRRSFLIAGAAAIGTSALSYGRIIGANDRISLGLIGAGRRGRELASVVADLKGSYNAEMTAVCDLWKVNRERAAQTAEHVYGRAPRSFSAARRSAGAEGRGRGDHLHRGFPACAHAQAGGRSGQGRLLRKAHGQRAGGGQGRARRRSVAQPGRADRHPAPQRALPDRGQGIDPARRARRRQQSRDGVELSRSTLARAR